MYCKACGEELGPPDQVLHDPDAVHDVTRGINENGISNPDDHHIRANDGPKGARLFCTVNGQVTTLTKNPDGGGSGDTPPNGEPSNEPQPSPNGEVYDLPEEEDSEDLVRRVVSNEVYGLSKPQIQEVADWVSIYDGSIPPGDLEEVLQNLKGISNKKAALMRKKYEALLNKHIRNQSSDDRGPSIGALGQGMQMGQGGGGRPQPRRARRPSPPQRGGGAEGGGGEKDPSQNRQERQGGSSGASSRRERRVERRNEMMDKTAKEIADQAAPIVAQEMTQNMGRLFSIPVKIIEAKAERDPDWFIEKMDELGLEMDDFLEPSETKKERMESGGGGGRGPSTQADAEIDNALDQMGQAPEPEPEPEPAQPGGYPEETEPEPTDNTKPQEPEPQGEHPMKAAPEDEEEQTDEGRQSEDDAFAELMQNEGQ